MTQPYATEQSTSAIDSLGYQYKNNKNGAQELGIQFLDYNQDTIGSIYNLKQVLCKIRRRMDNEGYRIENGRVVKK